MFVFFLCREGSSLNDSDSLTPKRKMLSCPICLDHERCVSLLVHTIGHEIIIGIIPYLWEVSINAYTTVSQNLIGCSSLGQRYRKPIGWYWIIMTRQLWTLTCPTLHTCSLTYPYNEYYYKLYIRHNMNILYCPLYSHNAGDILHYLSYTHSCL